MRVLLAHKFHRLTGGAEVFYFNVGDTLSEKGHSVAYFSTEHEENIKTENSYFVSTPKYDSKSLREKIFGSLDIFYSVSKKKDMLKAIDEFKPDVIHVFAIHIHLTPSILVAAKERNIPVVMSCNDYKHICPNYKLYAQEKLCEACKGNKFYNATLKRCSQNSLLFSMASSAEAYIHNLMGIYDKYIDKYLFASKFMLDKTKEFWPQKKVNYGILKNPFDSSEYSPKYDGSYGLYFGRIIEEKGVDILIDELGGLDFPVKIIGDGPDKLKLENICKEKGISNIEFLGPQWGDDLQKILIEAKLVIVPSTWHENFPYVIFQAFASGKPVIGSQRGGIPELIGDSRGLTFDPELTGDLRNAFTTLISDDTLAMELGKNARKYITDEFSKEKFYYSLIENYKSVI